MTSVFRKKTYTNRALAFDSYHSNNAKRAVIISMFDRVKSNFGKDDIHANRKKKENISMHCSKRMVTRGHLFRPLYGIAKQIKRNERTERARKRRRKNPKTRLFCHTLKVLVNNSKEC